MKVSEYRSPERVLGDSHMVIVYRYPTRDEGMAYHRSRAEAQAQATAPRPGEFQDGASDELMQLSVMGTAVDQVTELVTGLVIDGQDFQGTADAVREHLKGDWRFTSFLYEDSAYLFRFSSAPRDGGPVADGGAEGVPAES